MLYIRFFQNLYTIYIHISCGQYYNIYALCWHAVMKYFIRSARVNPCSNVQFLFGTSTAVSEVSTTWLCSSKRCYLILWNINIYFKILIWFNIIHLNMVIWLHSAPCVWYFWTTNTNECNKYNFLSNRYSVWLLLTFINRVTNCSSTRNCTHFQCAAL